MHIIGTPGEVKERVAQWEETGVTTLLLSCRSAGEVRQVAEPVGLIPGGCRSGGLPSWPCCASRTRTSPRCWSILPCSVTSSLG
ncbi:hypothetical protein [Nocardioides convexus]|uniref:hypothetical protein n=1 Tax=Nocardioides convexus TaxID=2712224 RepID=UPI0024189C07|nr:hypothetical protein [Nocardioides convexus]